jgi:hypothetical protein
MVPPHLLLHSPPGTKIVAVKKHRNVTQKINGKWKDKKRQKQTYSKFIFPL